MEGADCSDAQTPTTSTPDETPKLENASSPGTTPPPGTVTPAKAPMQESTLKLIDPGFEPKEGPYPQWIKNVTRDCVYKQLRSLNPCFWNTGKKCDGQNYMVITPATRPWFMDQKGAYGTIPNAYHEDWLNSTLPWIWVTPLQHLVGAFPEGQRWTGLGLKGLYKTDMYVQKVPRPNDLTSVPSGDFQNVDRCVAERIFRDLNNTVFVSDGKSPRCPLNQVRTMAWAHWIYDCSGLRANKTVKGVLQAWKEGYRRDSKSTWWGLEQDEVRRWVVPCLVNTSSYWLKYQYIATVYSKDRDIWPGMWSKPVPVVSPRPWAMSCNHANSTCMNGAGCIRCGLTLDQAKILWDVTPALWCTECYVGHFPIQSARGIMSRKDGLYTPMIVPELPMDLETRAEVVWNSLKAESGRTAVVTEYPNGIHYPVYTKIWEFPGGERVSTAHLTDGWFVAVGPRLPPLRTATGNNRGPTKPVTRAVETQTEWMVWCWEDRAGEISEIEPMAVDNLAVEANPDIEPEPPQRPPSIPTTPPEEPPTLQREDPVSKAYHEA
ncbi:hypothetical protein D5F01_LYC02209 [Larimichthys crocea]|uniref:Uncharacterized protein n=1 Tax=Larimichthys crocea TaxID=215358 RepID=A0A6G0J8C8_LARCR|nr:hypothetical protein D5F01_LYC02209 [Larimichthys crocea]